VSDYSSNFTKEDGFFCKLVDRKIDGQYRGMYAIYYHDELIGEYKTETEARKAFEAHKVKRIWKKD